MKKELLLAFLPVAINGSAAYDEIVKAGSTAVPMPQYAVFTDGLHDDIVPGGWLKEILVRQNNGLSSHPEAMSYPFDSKLWVGELKRDTESRGADWWRYEQTAYYVDGLMRLGYLLDDEKLLSVAKENVDWVLEHPLPAKKGIPFKPSDVDSMMSKNAQFTAEVSEDPKARLGKNASDRRLRRSCALRHTTDRKVVSVQRQSRWHGLSQCFSVQ